MNRKPLVIIIILFSLIVLTRFALQAQPPDNHLPPLPPYMPGERRPTPENNPTVNPLLTVTPTATPTPGSNFEASLLPKEIPHIRSTLEVIDTAPEIPHEQKIHLIIQRGKTGQEVLITIPYGVDRETILEKYLNLEDGDEFVRESRPLIRPPAWHNQK